MASARFQHWAILLSVYLYEIEFRLSIQTLMPYLYFLSTLIISPPNQLLATESSWRATCYSLHTLQTHVQTLIIAKCVSKSTWVSLTITGREGANSRGWFGDMGEESGSSNQTKILSTL